MTIKPLDILGKVRHAQMVSTRTNLMTQPLATTQQFIGIAHDIELLIDICQSSSAV